jgi:endo-1,4-beta-xylanase
LLKTDKLIDIIGVQGHSFSLNASSSILRKNLNLLANTGLPIHVTELDIDGYTDESQLNEYKRVFPILYEHNAVKGITLWGWKPGLWRDDQRAFIYFNNKERPALSWMREYLSDIVLNTKEQTSIPITSNLYNNYPNPFNPSTTIQYYVASSSKVILKVYDVLGKEIRTLVDKIQSAGSYSVQFNGEDISSGIYFYRLIAGDFISTKKLMLIK